MDETDLKAWNALRKYLQSHEEDIAHDINDFGDLRLVFITTLGREPQKEVNR